MVSYIWAAPPHVCGCVMCDISSRQVRVPEYEYRQTGS